jgi:predicted CXXCH cytochrome family protein
MKRIVLLSATLFAAQAVRAAPGVAGTRHDFSVTGPGAIHAVSERNPCVFCHVPHSGASNRPELTAAHTPYQSTTLQARPGAPTGATRACLSCHDGTIAVGETKTGRIATVGGVIAPDAPANLGTDLRRTHPVSFRPVPAAGVREPPAGDAVQLDRRGELQCTSCHDPHDEKRDPVVGKFLVKPSGRSALCLSCHESSTVAAAGSAHASSGASFGASQGNASGWASVSEAGCFACHLDHGADTAGQLVPRPRADVDGLCLRCHDGAVARLSIARELAKSHGHGGGTPGVHDAGEGLSGARRPLPESSPGAPRHASCPDCHDPHAASDRPAVAPGVSGALSGVWGVDQNGARVEQVRYEYEVCFKCHGDSANKPQAIRPDAGDPVRRQVTDVNLRLVFASSAASAHPVVGRASGADSPSLKAPWNAGRLITCGDCHGSDDGPANGGGGARGPHGSLYPHLLEREYLTAAGAGESPGAYALCYKCHDRDVLLADGSVPDQRRSAFPLHGSHLRAGATCATCHDAHGVSAQAAAQGGGAHLVSFDVSVVQPLSSVLRYESSGFRSGSCTLTCHDHPHEGAAYSQSTTASRPASGLKALRRTLRR